MNSRIEGQLTRVLNNPLDDSERALYAEMLREEDDPRGEFIALQLLRDPTRDQSNRIKDLTKTHAKRFLGPLDKIVVNQDREFTRGFLSKCIVRRNDVFDLVRHPATATIEDIRVLPRRCGTAEYELSTPKRALDLGPLTEFVSLRKLDLRGTYVTDLRQLTKVTKLEKFNIAETSVSDLRPLARLTSLETLNITDTQVSDLGPLAELTKLKELRLAKTQVSDVGPLAGLTDLETLHCGFTEVTDLAALTKLVKLAVLSFPRTLVADLGPLANLTRLRHLGLSHTAVSDLSPLARLMNMEALYLVGTLVSDLEPLANLKMLKTLRLWRTKHLKLELKKLWETLPMVRATYGDPSLSIPDDDFQRWLRSGWRSMTEKEFFRTCWGKDDRSR